MLEVRPIVVADGIVVGGNMRLLAMKELGFREVTAIDVTDWTQGQRDEFMIKDNLNFGDWDYDMLANEWEGSDLADWGMDLWETEVEEMQGLTDEDEVPEAPEEPTTKLGDVWILGEHRVMCGDSTSKEAVEILMDGEKADLLLTDPPYGIGIAANPVRQKHIKKDWDKKPIEPKQFLHLADKAIIFGGNYFELPPSKGYFVWDKKQPENFTLAMCEMAWTNIDTPAKMFRLSVTSYKKEHPTQKPIELLEWVMSYCEGLILDPFLGSGSTLIAAEKTGRKCYGMELDPKYCDVIVKRWEDFTGKKAHLEEKDDLMIIAQAQ